MPRLALLLCVLLTLSSCASLHPHDSAWGSAGEVTVRMIAAPLTLGMSELIMMMEEKRREERQAQQRWFDSLTPEQQVRYQSSALYGAGLALRGGGPFRHAPYGGYIAPVPVPVPQMTSCMAQPMGVMTSIHCY